MAKLPSLKYVKFVRSKGKLYAYFNTGKKVGNKLVWASMPAPSSTGFHDTYAAMLGHRSRRENDNTVASLADKFENAEEFGKLAKGTQRLYGITLKRIREHLGKFPVDGVQRKHVREVVENRLTGNGARNAFLAVLGVLYTWARRRDITEAEPTKDIQPYKLGEHEPWPEEVLNAGLEAEHERTRLAINLLYYGGQRIGDTVRMRWSDYRDGAIFITQEKTGKALRIPVHSSLALVLERTPRRGITILCNHIGQAMTPQVIRRELKAFGEAHGLALVPHGLRKNAVNALLEAGCTIAETGSITGQSFRIVEKYARGVSQHKLGNAAMLKFENRTEKLKPTIKLPVQAAN